MTKKTVPTFPTLTVQQLCHAVSICHQHDDFQGALKFANSLERLLHRLLKAQELSEWEAINEARKLESWCDDCACAPCNCDGEIRAN